MKETAPFSKPKGTAIGHWRRNRFLFAALVDQMADLVHELPRRYGRSPHIATTSAPEIPRKWIRVEEFTPGCCRIMRADAIVHLSVGSPGLHAPTWHYDHYPMSKPGFWFGRIRGALPLELRPDVEAANLDDVTGCKKVFAVANSTRVENPVEPAWKRSLDAPALNVSIGSRFLEINHCVRRNGLIGDDSSLHPDRCRDVEQADGVMRLNGARAHQC